MIAYLVVIKVAVAWALLWLIFSGLGLGVRRLFGRGLAAFADLRLTPWLGWGGAIVFLQFWHLWSPVNATALAVVALGGLAGWAWHAPRIVSLLKANRRDVLLYVLLFGACALWVANNAVRQPGIYDSGLYHLNGVRWVKEFAIVPGLGNLHGRLAYNNASFLYAAMLDTGPFLHRAHHVASGFLILLLLMQSLAAWRQLCIQPAPTSSSVRFYTLVTAPLVVWVVNAGYTSSLSPDVPSFLLALLLAGELLAMQAAASTAATPEDTRRAEPYGSLCFLAMIGITVKLSFAAYGVTAGALALLLHGVARRRAAAWWGGAAVTVALTVAVLVPWMLRGLIISGYPAYPATLGRVPVDWAISEEAASGMTRTILAWARAPGAPPETVLNTWSWLGPWFRRTLHENAFDFTAPILTALVGLTIAAWRLRRRALPLRPLAWLVLLPALAGDVVWFIAAPDPRYQGAMLWALGLVTLVLALEGARPSARWLCVAHAALVLAVFVQPINLIRTWKNVEPARRVPMKTMVTDSGLTVYVPVTGDQAWDSELPATPYFAPRLRLRVPGDMAQGFNKQAEAAPLRPLCEVLTGRQARTQEEPPHE